jgi:hypothetical protein
MTMAVVAGDLGADESFSTVRGVQLCFRRRTFDSMDLGLPPRFTESGCRLVRRPFDTADRRHAQSRWLMAGFADRTQFCISLLFCLACGWVAVGAGSGRLCITVHEFGNWMPGRRATVWTLATGLCALLCMICGWNFGLATRWSSESLSKKPVGVAGEVTHLAVVR